MIIANSTVSEIESTGKEIEKLLEERLKLELSDFEQVKSIALFGLKDIGLRLRPFFLKISYTASGRNFDDVKALASAVELIQISTLIIDDFLDDSLLRNHRPSIYSKWGSKQAVCSGTYLSSYALNLFVQELNSRNNFKNQGEVSSLLLKSHSDIYLGQFMDISIGSNPEFNESEYFDLIKLTTGSFISASLEIGAMLWGADSTELNRLKKIGLNLGLAYQMRDDVLDIVGETAYMGKPAFRDIYERKMRLPIIFALKNAMPDLYSKIIQLLLKKSNLVEEDILFISRTIISSGAIEYTIEKIKYYCNKAIEEIDDLSDQFSECSEHLRTVANLISDFDTGNS